MPTSETLMDDGDEPLRRKVAGCNGFAAFRSVVYAKTVVFDNMRRKCFLALAPKIQKILAIHTAVTFAALNVWRNGVFRHKISFLNVLKETKTALFVFFVPLLQIVKNELILNFLIFCFAL